MNEKKNIFGHSTVAKPAAMPSDNRFAQMTDMLKDTEEEQEQDTQDASPADLEQLIFLGRVQDSKVVSGFTFDLQTLTAREQNDVWMSVSFLNNETKFFVIKVAFLAKAIVAVNGRDLEVLYKGKDFRAITPEQRCLKVVESWQQPLVDELYEFYSDLLERSRKVIKPAEIKK
jgi:hypothetical protein